MGVREQADSIIDTTLINLHQLRDLIRQRVEHPSSQSLTLLFESFGFKHGMPAGADFVFDVRCLPNPYWEPTLRGLTGQDTAVQRFFSGESKVEQMVDSVASFLEIWIPRFEADNRAYLTVCIGCTGGQHRSVYIAEELGRRFGDLRKDVIVRHRRLSA
ncbi:MAG: RNase adapter RapZ, partial [Pseudomonadota bacterium]